MEKRHSFENDIQIFIDHIESLYSSLPIVLGTISLTNTKAIKLHSEFLQKDCEKIEEEGGGVSFFVKPELVRRNRALRKEITHSSIAHKIIQRNYIVSLVSQFDSFIGSLIKTIFYLQPDYLNKSEKQLTFANLVDFGNIEDAREYIIEKEIESVLRENHTNHFKWLEGKLGIPLRKDLMAWPIFIELTERRNLYVHNNGIVSSQYLKICDENNVVFEKRPLLGEELVVDTEYFNIAFKCVFELGVKLSQVLWRKLTPKKIEDADGSILEISYELIQNKHYDLAQELLDFCDKYVKKYSSDDLKFRIILNRAQAYKWAGNDEKCKEIVSGRDWSAASDIFKLASQVLLDRFDHALMTMKSIGNSSKEINKNSYREWPIFNDFRKEKKFLDCFELIYGEPFDTKEAYALSGYRIVDKTVFMEKLDECLKIAKSRKNGFVGSKFFIETQLAKGQYDIGKSWELFNKLVEEKSIETYLHEDLNGEYPPLQAIRKCD